MWALLYGTQDNLNRFLNQIEKFAISGLTLNYDKTQIMRVGSLRDSDARFYTLKPLHWVEPYSPQRIKVLGIRLGTPQALDSNYDNVFEKLNHIINVWSLRPTNILGKITLINSLMTSLLVYTVLMVALPPAHFCIKFKNKILKFLWDNKPHRIRYSKLINSGKERWGFGAH